MIVLMKEHYHTYAEGDRTAEVWRTMKGQWATRHYDKQGGKASLWIKDVVHEGKSERWAEDAAENWVLRVNC